MSKLIIGLDIAKEDFKACIQSQLPNGEIKIKGSRTFKNTSTGYTELLEWTEKRIKPYHDSILFVMEATGVYYEDLAYYLFDKNHKVSVLLPNKVKHFTKSLNIVSKTDKIDARIIAQIGIERKLKYWEPMCPQYKELKSLNRKRLSLDKEKKRAKNQLHAMNHAHKTSESVIEVTKKQIEFYLHQIQVLEEQIEGVIMSNPELDEKINKVATLKGVGRSTIITILCETNGFGMVRNIRQLVSYAGLDIVFNDSGQFKGKTRISKRGNSRIRECLYMPALSAKQHNAKIKNLNDRVVAKNPKIKQKGTVACMRKLLVLVYTLWNKNEAYDSTYEAA